MEPQPQEHSDVAPPLLLSRLSYCPRNHSETGWLLGGQRYVLSIRLAIGGGVYPAKQLCIWYVPSQLKSMLMLMCQWSYDSDRHCV